MVTSLTFKGQGVIKVGQTSRPHEVEHIGSFSLSKYIRIPPEAPRFAGSIFQTGRGEGLSPAIASPISLAVVGEGGGKGAKQTKKKLWVQGLV